MTTRELDALDRKSTRLNSSHSQISYAVFCLKKKNRHHKAHVHEVSRITAEAHGLNTGSCSRSCVYARPRIHIHSSTQFRLLFFFFFNDTATTEIYPLSLHDALPISNASGTVRLDVPAGWKVSPASALFKGTLDRKSTRLNSSHGYISYAVFCLKKKINVTTLHHVGVQTSGATLTEVH